MVGHVPLLVAANRARRRRKDAEAVMGWKRWSPEQRAEFGRGAAVAEVWDYAIAPVITEEAGGGVMTDKVPEHKRQLRPCRPI